MDDQSAQDDPGTERIDEGTHRADEADASVHAGADREPTADEEQLAERSAQQVDVDAVAEHYEEMADLGANIEGEGRIGG